MVAVGVPSEDLEIRQDWADHLLQVRMDLQKKVADQQHEIRRRLEEQGDDVYSLGQIVLLKKTKHERSQDHTKIADRYHHPARVIEAMPNGVTYKVKLLGMDDEKSSQIQIVNRRNLRPLYEAQDEDDDPVTMMPRFPLAEVEHKP